MDVKKLKSIVTESGLLDKFLTYKGLDPRFVSRNTKVAHSKTGEFQKWVKDRSLAEDMGHIATKGEGGKTAERKDSLKKSIDAYKEIKTPRGPGQHESKSQTPMVTPESVEFNNESLGDDFAKMLKDKGIKHRVHGTPDQERQRTADKLAANKAHADSAPKKKAEPGTFGTTRGYGQGRYMGDSVELEGDTLDEVSSELLGRYKEKAKKSADDLTAAGKHKQATDRHMNVMKATGKQMDKTISGIKKSLAGKLVKEIYAKHRLKEDMFDHEKEDKSVATYGKKPKFEKADPKDSQGEKKPQAAAILTGGKTLTGSPRDTIEIDPVMRNRPGQPDVTKKEDKKDDKKKDEKKDK